MSYDTELARAFTGAQAILSTRFSVERKPADIPVEQPTKLDLIINLHHRKGHWTDNPETFLSPAPTR